MATSTKKLHAGHIEYAVVQLLNYRVYTIVPNVSWGMGFNHECDLLALDNKNRFTEIEIKVTASDLKADFKKAHGHRSEYISRLVYAMPMNLAEKYSDIIPKECGIIAVDVVTKSKWQTSDLVTYRVLVAEWWRQVKHAHTEEVPQKKILKFMQLGCMRIWSLKAHNNGKLDHQKELTSKS